MVLCRIDRLDEMARAACSSICGFMVVLADECNYKIHVAYVPNVDEPHFAEIKVSFSYNNGDLTEVYKAALRVLTEYAVTEQVH